MTSKLDFRLKQNYFTIVSGLPRSGTSLMMQMLAAGGIEPMTDEIRAPDKSNPKGYFEWEMIKRIGMDHRLLEQPEVQGKAIKVISTLLPQLPKAHNYKVLFMQRNISEILQSQELLLQELHKTIETQDPIAAGEDLVKHNMDIIKWAQNAPHIDVLQVEHAELMRNPQTQIKNISAFLGADALKTPHLMKNVIDTSLYRNRESGLLQRLLRRLNPG